VLRLVEQIILYQASRLGDRHRKEHLRPGVSKTLPAKSVCAARVPLKIEIYYQFFFEKMETFMLFWQKCTH